MVHFIKRKKPNRPKKVASYKRTKSRVQTTGWITSFPKETRANAERILKYSGIDKIDIPGTFLAEALTMTNLTVTDLIQILDLSKSTFYRAQKEDKLEMETVDKLSSLFKIYQFGIETFEGKGAFEEWLRSRIVNLGNQKPVDLIKSENGRVTVLDAIHRVEYGIYG